MPSHPARHVPMVAVTPELAAVQARVAQLRRLVGMTRAADDAEAERIRRVTEEVDLAEKHLHEALHYARPEIEGGDDGGH